MKMIGEFKKIGSPETVVLSRTMTKPEDKNIQVARSPAEGVKKQSALGFKHLVISGGGKVNGS